MLFVATGVGFWWLLEQLTQLLTFLLVLVPTTSGTHCVPLPGQVSTAWLLGNLGLGLGVPLRIAKRFQSCADL